MSDIFTPTVTLTTKFGNSTAARGPAAGSRPRPDALARRVVEPVLLYPQRRAHAVPANRRHQTQHRGRLGHHHLHCARSCRTQAGTIVRSIRHRGLRQLFENDSSRLLKQDLVERVRGILAALAMAENMEGFIREAAPGWRVHRLSGERRNEWSVSVSGNWRITFEERSGAIERVNLEDDH